MSELTRFGVSIDSELLRKFDQLIGESGWGNRSEALRDLIRVRLVEEQWSSDDEVVGTVTIVYDHHVRELAERLTAVQHDHHDLVLSAIHVHLDHDNCLEVIIVKGAASEVRNLASHLIGARGVKHGELVTTTTGSGL
jgi:CopG family transcriptional regulator, nickel-responsive regulator